MKHVREAIGLAFTGVAIGVVLVACLVIGQNRQGDEFPGCAAACHSDAAYAEVQSTQAQAGAAYVCWAEDNAEMPSGYEVLCRAKDLPPVAHQPEEDEPGWNCATMGNRQCGPTSTR